MRAPGKRENAQTIRHVVLSKLTRGIPSAEFEAWIADIERMRGNIPGMLELSHGSDIRENEEPYDYALVAYFESLEALDAYETHPLHEPVTRFLLRNSEKTQSTDCVVLSDE